jgi:hypothetical protein
MSNRTGPDEAVADDRRQTSDRTLAIAPAIEAGTDGVMSWDVRATVVPGPSEFHDDATRAGTVQFGSALLAGIPVDSTPTVSPAGRAFPRMRGDQRRWRREELGLVSTSLDFHVRSVS